MRAVVLAVAVLGASCEKSGPAESGELTAVEASLAVRLPKDAAFVFGGQFGQLGKFVESSAYKRLVRMVDKFAPGSSGWTECFAKRHQSRMLGTMAMTASRTDVRYVMTDITVDDLEQCAKTANYIVTIDDDRRFITIDPKTPEAGKLAYLAIAEGVYGGQRMAMPGGVPVPAIDRKLFEDELATAAKSNITDNAALLRLIMRADRTKALWFAGSGATTPMAGKVGEVVGSADFADGLAVDVTVELESEALAEQVIDNFDQAKSAAGLAGKEFKDAINSIKLKRNGAKIRGTMALPLAKLEAALEKLGPFMR